jgi:endoglucanase
LKQVLTKTKGQTADPTAGLPGTFGKEYAFISKAGVDVYVDDNKVRL